MDFSKFGETVQELLQSLGLDIANEQLLVCTGIGVVAGWLASQIIGGKGGIIRYLVAGILGSFLGPVIVSFFGFTIPSIGIVFADEVILATIGATAIVVIARILG